MRRRMFRLGLPRVYLFRRTSDVPPGSIVLFPLGEAGFGCGFFGILDFKPNPRTAGLADTETLLAVVDECAARDLDAVLAGKTELANYAGGDQRLVGLWEWTEALKERDSMVRLVESPAARKEVEKVTASLQRFIARDQKRLTEVGSALESRALETVNAGLVRTKDIAWALEREVLATAEGALGLAEATSKPSGVRAWELVKLHSTLENLGRLEVRGRDSAGISLIVNFATTSALAAFEGRIASAGLQDEYRRRQRQGDFGDGSIVVGTGPLNPSVSFVVKVAAEVGKLGDNVRALRTKIRQDAILHGALESEFEIVTSIAHTRWASNGIINLSNCHPLDQRTEGDRERFEGTIQVALNGDIDNYPELKAAYEKETGRRIPAAITTDAKIVATWIERYVRAGVDVAEAFRRAVSEFRGSAAIVMHTDLAPGRVFLSLKGSGQAIYVGLASDRLVYSSEVYGLVSETSRYFRMDGEKTHDPGDPASQGQIVILDHSRPSGLAGIVSRAPSGLAIEIKDQDLRRAAITTRDIDRKGFDHFFLKEISEAPQSVAKTLIGKFTVDSDKRARFNLGEEILPERIVRALGEDRRIRRIYVVGQGTASVAALGIASILGRYLRESPIQVEGKKASELSGFHLTADMSDTLVIAVTQSGTTTDTNRAIDMIARRGASRIAIVNRRGSDITDKVQGVFYTSDGRDVEMSVASTKAFYSQVVAGAVLAARIAQIVDAAPSATLVEDLEDLQTLPARMGEVLARADKIAESARRLAPAYQHWAVVGSGPNAIAAQEVRIKLSELCYKSIACDTIEDKKHIDLSAEPLVLVLAAGNQESVLADCVKDVAIFKAHKAAPVVFAAEPEERFGPYAEFVIGLPRASETVSMLANTMAGHIWGYHAALAIGAESEFLKEVRSSVVSALEKSAKGGGTAAEESALRRLDALYREFQRRKAAGRYRSSLSAETCANLVLLFRYAIDGSSLDHFEAEFGRPGSREAVYREFLANLNRAIEDLSRPIDAIKHQAKTVTVGTSRIEAFGAGILFDALREAAVSTREISYRDTAIVGRLQDAIASCEGFTLYRIENLDAVGNPRDDSRITVERKAGVAKKLRSRADKGTILAGSKRSIVYHKNVHLGVGKGDGRTILIVPLYDQRYRVNRLALFHVGFVTHLAIEDKVRVLGGSYEDLKNAVTEANVPWTDEFLDPFSPEFLLTRTPEEVAEAIVERGREMADLPDAG